MQENKKKCMDLANRIYDLDEKVYKCVGSALGRTFTGNRESTVQNLCMMMLTKPDGHLLRSELALIGNMARTIPDKEEKSRMLTEYDSILKEIEKLPDSFGQVDIIDLARAELNLSSRRKLSESDHLVICISRTQGSAGNDIGFELADDLHINYYDVEIFNQVLNRLEAEKGSVNDAEAEHFTYFDKYRKRSFRLKTWFREFNRYHGLPRQDAVFFNMSDLICNLARTEDCVIMGRCADAILTNNHIPHISLFISAQGIESAGPSVTNLSALSSLTELRTLELWARNLTDISPLSALTGLQSAVIQAYNTYGPAELTDVSALDHVPSLTVESSGNVIVSR